MRRACTSRIQRTSGYEAVLHAAGEAFIKYCVYMTEEPDRIKREALAATSPR